MMGTGCVPSEHAGHSPPPLPPTLTVHSSDHCQELSAGSGVMGGDSSEGRRVRQAEKGKTWILLLISGTCPMWLYNLSLDVCLWPDYIGYIVLLNIGTYCCSLLFCRPSRDHPHTQGRSSGSYSSRVLLSWVFHLSGAECERGVSTSVRECMSIPTSVKDVLPCSEP